MKEFVAIACVVNVGLAFLICLLYQSETFWGWRRKKWENQMEKEIEANSVSVCNCANCFVTRNGVKQKGLKCHVTREVIQPEADGS